MKSGQSPWRAVVLVVIVLVLLAGARHLGLGERLGEMKDWITSLGPLGPVVFVLIYVVAVVAALPGSAITLAAGAMFGSVAGVVLVSIGSTIGAGLAFLIARYFARESVSRWLSGNEKFARLDEMTQRHGAVIVALTRLVPVFPFNLLNYGFGLTRVPFKTYIFWSWLCMLPGTVVYVVGADTLARGVTGGGVPWGLAGTLAAAVVLLVLLVRFAKKKLADKEREGDGG